MHTFLASVLMLKGFWLKSLIDCGILISLSNAPSGAIKLPLANNNPENPYFRIHGSETAWVFGTLTTIRDSKDLWSEQLTTGYFASFIRNSDPNPSLSYLDVRGYEKEVEGAKKFGAWKAVDATSKDGDEIRFLDWPSESVGYQDVEQCAWLGYPLDYYLKGGI